MSNQGNQNAARSTVQVRAAGPGSQVVVDASNAERLAFDFDISSANMSRSGNDLFFETDNGGSIRINGFFAPADGMNLPEFVLPDHTIVKSADILAAYDIDVTPASGAVAGGGLGAYNSDSGSLIGGLEGSGDLDPFFWGAGATRGEDFSNNRYPGGSFDFSISTDLNGAFSAVLYEDARPNQHLGDDTVMAGRINMNINPNSGSTVGEIRISGLPAGAKLFVGDPENGGQEVLPDANGVYHFNAGQFSGAGVYITPPADSDVDMRLNVSVDFSDSGRVAFVEGFFTVIVDAVADQPYNVVADEVSITNDLHGMSKSTVDSDFADGYNKQAVTVESGTGEGKVSVTLNVTGQFSDYDPADASETHYVLVELPDGFTPAANYETYTDPSDGTVYIMVPADGAIDPNTGLATVEITLETISYSADTDINLKTGAMSVEEVSDRDLDGSNNVSVVIPDEAGFHLDVVDAALNISVGWASEGNNAGGYLGSGTHVQNFAGMNDDYSENGIDPGPTGLDSASTASNLGAPIVIELDAASGSGNNSIEQVVLTLEAGRGVLVDGSGAPLTPDTPGGNTYTINGDISAGEVYFRPNADSYDNSDVSVGYQVTVKNTEGATATYTGTASAVVDAVADFAALDNLTANYGSDTYGDMSAAKPGGTVELTMDVNFPDTTAGNENHYVLIAAGVGDIDAYGKCLITDAGGNTLVEVDLSGMTPVDGYYQVQVPSSYGDVKVSVEVTVDGGITSDTTITLGMGSKTEAVEAFDDSGDKEYDAANNASTNVNDVAIEVAPANSGASEKTTGTYETDANGQVRWDKHDLTGTLIVKDGSSTITGNKVTVTDSSQLGDITFSLNSGSDSAEHFTQIQFTIEGNLDDLGSLTLKGASEGVSLSYSYDSTSNTTTVTITDSSPSDSSITVKFTPDAFSDADLKIMDYELDFINAKSHDAGNISVGDGTSAVATVVVDAVAAKATDLKASAADYEGDQSQAKAGEEVKIKFEMKVPETIGDADEKHGLTLKVAGNDGYNSVTLSGASGGDLVIAFDATGMNAVGSTASDIKVNGQPSSDFTVTLITINGTQYYQISGPGFESYLDAVSGNVSGEISFDAAFSGTNLGSGDYRPGSSVGLLTVDVTSDASDSTGNNNVSFSEKTYNYEVGGVASTVGMTVTNAYENAAKDANGQFVSRGSLLAAIADAENNPAAAADAVAQLKASSSAVSISGIAGDESITKAVFVADYPASASGAGEVPGQFMYQDVLIDVPGGPVIVNGVTINCMVGDNGQVTITIEGDDIDLGAGNLYFVPGENYSHNDVTVNYGITVTDDASGQDKVFASDHDNPALFPADTGELRSGVDYDPAEGNPSVINIDAVAQRPDITSVSIETLPGAAEDTIAHGSTAAIKIDVDLHGDLDGTEGRLFYVKTTGNDYPVESVIIEYQGADGNTYTITVPASDLDLQRTNLGGEADGTATYHMLNIDEVINGSANPPLGSGEITITVNVGTPGSGSGSTVDFGISSHEDWNDVQKGWEAGSSDNELYANNNNAWNAGSVYINLSSASRPSMSLDQTAFFENNNAAANTGEYNGGTGIPLSFNLGDGNDTLTGFNVSLNGENANLGDLVLFDSVQSYNEFVAAVEALSPGETAHEILDEFIAEGKVLKADDEITLDDIAGMLGENAAGETVFTGKIVFMPAEDSYSAIDPQIDCTIVVRDDASGQYASNGGYKGDSESAAEGSGSSAALLADAVAQKPDAPAFDADSGANIDLAQGGTRTVTISAAFGDSDPSTEHYILVEAKAGWTLTYEGQALNLGNLQTYEEGGTVYYKIPVSPTFDGSDTGTASIEVTLKAPSNALYYQDGYSYDFEVRAGSTDKDMSGGELTFHNNTAVSDAGDSLSGTVTGYGHGGTYHFRQTSAVYEDNNPDSHLKGDDPANDSTGGTFSLGDGNCPGGYAIIECPVDANGAPVFTIDEGTWDGSAWRVDLDANGQVNISVTLSEEYLAGEGAHNDADLHFDKITFYDSSDAPQSVIDNSGGLLDVIVDAVADRADLQDESVNVWDSATDAHRLDDAVAGGKSGGAGADDVTAKFTVNAAFPDTGGESHYILVEKVPAWEYDGAADEVHLDGKTYYKIDVTGEVQSDGSLSFEVGMKYVGAVADMFGTGQNGVTSYELNYGTMSQESVTGGEVDLQNNIAINLEGQVTLKYSPVTSSITMSVGFTSNAEGVGNTITLHLNQIDSAATQDELISLSISYDPSDGSAGTLWLTDAQGNHISEVSPGDPFSDADLAMLSSGGYKLVFEQAAYNHQDISFSWSGTVKDIVSGATANTSGGTTIVMDAEAQDSLNNYAGDDGSITVADKVTEAGGVMSGNSALVTIKADFPDAANVDNPGTQAVEGSEEHWVVLEQSDFDYSVLNAKIYGADGLIDDNATVVTKFGPDGTPYFAVQVPAGTDISVVFEVTTPSGLTSDTQISLNGGTITIENTKNGPDGEPNYDNNWNANIGQDAVEIQVGVLETEAVTVSAETGIDEGGYSQLSFTGINAAYNEEAVITVELPQGVTLYTYDGNDYTPVTGDPLTITYHNVDGQMVPDHDYYLNAGEHSSGNVTIKYTVEVTDTRTGEQVNLGEESASFTIKGVASGSELDGDSYNAQDSAAAHSASVTITPTFEDADGSEAHYLLFLVPEGMTVDGASAFTLDAAAAGELGLEPGNYYRMDVSGKSGEEVTVNLASVGGVYNAQNDSITVWSMSEESGGYAVSDHAVINVGDLNEAVTAAQAEHDITAGVESGWTVCGDLGLAVMFTDLDGDTLSYSFNYGGEDYALDAANGVDIPGSYGTLHIDAGGAYTYTPNAGEANDSFYLEDFSGIKVTASDGYGSSAESTVDIGFDALGALYGNETDDSLTDEVGGMTVYGGAGNDAIHAHEDGSVIFGGTGSDTMYAGDGNDVFVWRDGDLESGLDTIVGFDMGSDKLFIEGLLSSGGSAEEHENELTSLLSDGDLLLSMQSDSKITLEYEGQTVELQLKSAVDSETFSAMSDDSGSSDAAKAQMLMNILNSSM